MKYFFLLLGVLLAAGTTVCGQSAIDARKQELKELRNSIKKTQQRLHTLRAEEKKASRSLTGLQRQRHSITLFIRELQDTLTRLTDSATALEGRIRQTRQALTDVEQSYNAALRSLAVWKSKNRGTPHDDGTTASLFRSLTRSVVQYRGRMVELRDSLNKQQDLLSDYTRTQTVVLQAKAGQEKVLNRTIQKSSKELRSLQSSKRATQRELNTKTASLRKLSSIINKLVAEARRKADAERRASEKKSPAGSRSSGRSAKAPSTESAAPAFSANSLPWPTSGRKLIHGYGAYKNSETGTTLDNPGIDIAAPEGSPVSCVASGKVSSVTWLPGFGSLVIVDHENGIRTVYANLASVNVSQGSRVKQGTLIGKSGENMDGALVHFEIWNGRNRLNPLTYLR